MTPPPPRKVPKLPRNWKTIQDNEKGQSDLHTTRPSASFEKEKTQISYIQNKNPSIPSTCSVAQSAPSCHFQALLGTKANGEEPSGREKRKSKDWAKDWVISNHLQKY